MKQSAFIATRRNWYIAALIISIFSPLQIFADDSSAVQAEFVSHIGTFDTGPLEAIATQNNGRLKPLHTLARETNLFITGKYSLFQLSPIQFYLGIPTFAKADQLEIINIRSPQARETLGFPREQRWVSLAALKASKLQSLAEPLAKKQEQNKRLVTNPEHELLEVYSQFWATQALVGGQHLLQSMDFSQLKNGRGMAGHSAQAGEYLGLVQALLQNLAQHNFAQATQVGSQLLVNVPVSELPPTMMDQFSHMELEVLYNKIRIFFFLGILIFLLGILMLFPQTHKFFNKTVGFALLTLPLFIFAAGFLLRIRITSFAPVTNMYGTMLWVSFGVVLFSLLLIKLYKKYQLVGWVWIGAATLLFLTESMPLVLSPSLDPIVAVLRSNFWLTIHVLTITISYAAFTVATVLANVVLIKAVANKDYSDKAHGDAVHLIYRTIQLGVFLLSVGIILGGVWADYSWGRFWGWDPKETWALIADIGFLAILHGRYAGWVKNFGFVLFTPLAYLLVIMAWYGVNFILASGLHSYGFSSGGTKVVATYVILQLSIVTAGYVARGVRTKSWVP